MAHLNSDAAVNSLANKANTLMNNSESLMRNLSNVKSMIGTMTTQSYAGDPNHVPAGYPPSLPMSYYQTVPPGIFKENPTMMTNNQPPVMGIPGAMPPSLPQLYDLVRGLERSIATQDQLVQQFVQEIHDLQQYTRKNSILVHGLELPTEKEDLQGYKFSNFVCDKLNQLFTPKESMSEAAQEKCKKVQSLVGPVTSRTDIDATHVLPTKKKAKKTVIVVKFVSRLVRNEFFYNKSALKGTGITISEHLSPHQLDLQAQVRNALGYDAKVWTDQGKIFGIVKGQKQCFKSKSDIERFTRIRP